uniref:Uncharacterized protein n=1 Tax=Tanacetum cinerariifolium TaxID=118510 RepID=A0A6L2NJF8_TANCI|nr:hypothetical protein [Tanacetum cinerariifolium]
MDDSLEKAVTTATSLDVEQDRGNISKTQSKATPNKPGSQLTSSGGGLSLERRVKRLERRKRSRTHGLKRLCKVGLSARVESSEDEDKFVVKPVVENKSSEEETTMVRKNTNALIIEEWVSDNEKKNMTQPKIEKKTVRPSIVKKEFVKPRQQEKTARKTVKKVKHNRQNIHRPRGNQRN